MLGNFQFPHSIDLAESKTIDTRIGAEKTRYVNPSRQSYCKPFPCLNPSVSVPGSRTMHGYLYTNNSDVFLAFTTVQSRLEKCNCSATTNSALIQVRFTMPKNDSFRLRRSDTAGILHNSRL